jgi:hypothetical protein
MNKFSGSEAVRLPRQALELQEGGLDESDRPERRKVDDKLLF